jgi:hypothetical protein
LLLAILSIFAHRLVPIVSCRPASPGGGGCVLKAKQILLLELSNFVRRVEVAQETHVTHAAQKSRS